MTVYTHSYRGFVQIYDRDNLINQIPFPGAALPLVSATSTSTKNQIDSASYTIPRNNIVHLGTTYGWPHWVYNTGKIAAIYAYDNIAQTTIPIGTVELNNPDRQVNANTDGTLTVTGPSIMNELARNLRFVPIGTYQTEVTEVTANEPGPYIAQLTEAADTGQEYVQVAGVEIWTKVIKGDEVQITLDNGTIHTCDITEIDGNNIQLSLKLAGPALNGNRIEFRRKRLRVDSTVAFYAGDIINVERDHPTAYGGQFHIYDAYQIDRIDFEGSTKFFWLKTGLLDSASTGNFVQKISYSTPTPQDIEQALDEAQDWSVTKQAGRTSESAIGTAGATVFSCLERIANEHGEFFRMHQTLSNDELPVRRIYWGHTPDSSGITLTNPTASEMEAAQANPNIAIITDITERPATKAIVNKVYVQPANTDAGPIDISQADTDLINDLCDQYDLIYEHVPGAAYTPPSLLDANSASDFGVYEHMLSVDVTPQDLSAEATTSAANSMFRSAVHWLVWNARPRKEYQITCIPHKDILPGQTVIVDYSDPFNEMNLSGTLQVLEVPKGGGPEGLFFVLSCTFDMEANANSVPTDHATVAAEIIKLKKRSYTINQIASRGNYRSDPNALNFKAGDGIAITGGTDISVVASDLAGENISVSANNFQVNRTTLAGKGLAPSGIGPALDTLIGFGLEHIASGSNFVTAVKQTTDSGLTNSAGALVLGTPTNVGKTTPNSVFGTTHSHAVLSAVDGDASPNSIMATDANGYMKVRSLTSALNVTTPLVRNTAAPLSLEGSAVNINSAATNPTWNLNNYTAQIYGNMSFTNAAPLISTSAGRLTMAPVGGLTINPGNKDVTFPWTVDSQLHSDNYISQLAGWSLSHGTTGAHLDIRSLFADEFRVKAFIAEIEMALAGGMIITKSRGVTAAAFTTPSTTGTARTVIFNDLPGWEGYPIFDPRNDGIVMLAWADFSNGQAQGAKLWGYYNKSSYTDLGNGQQSWSIIWTYLGTGNFAGNKKIPAGATILYYGVPGEMPVIEMTTNDASGSPYIRTYEINSVLPDNRPDDISVYYQAGQLMSLENVGDEKGAFMGDGTKRQHAIFTDKRAEIHHAELTMYGTVSNDSLTLRLHAIEINTNTTLAAAPQTDISNTGTILRSSGTNTYESYIDENPSSGQPDANWISNEAGRPATLTCRLESISGTPTEVNVKAFLTKFGTSSYGDDVQFWVCVEDQAGNAITETKKIAQWSTLQTTTITINFVDIRPGASWTNARIRMEWVYKNSLTTPTIRLSPDIPAIAVGNPLPTGMNSGGNGIYLGRNDLDLGENYGARIGRVNGTRLEYRDDGTTGTLSLIGGTNQTALAVYSNGDAYLQGAFRFGIDGGIWQGTGVSFNSIGTGIKMWNSNGVGRFATYNNDVGQVYTDSEGKLIAGGGAVILDQYGIAIESADTAGSLDRSNMLTYLHQGQARGGIHGDYYGINIYPVNPTPQNVNTIQAIKLTTSTLTLGNLDKSYLELPNSASAQLTSPNGIVCLARGTYSPIILGTEGGGITLAPGNVYQARLTDTTTPIQITSTRMTHGMTSIAPTNTLLDYTLLDEWSGGVALRAFSEAGRALQFNAHVVNETAGYDASLIPPIRMNVMKRSGTGTQALTNTAALFAISNNYSNKLVLAGNGDIYAGAHQHVYDDHDDIGLITALDRVTSRKNLINDEWDRLVGYNKDTLIELGLLSEDGELMNINGWVKVITGAIRQLARSR